MKHLGFKNASAHIAKKQHMPIERAEAVLAAGARKASMGAVKANPRLLRVTGVKKPSGR